jgi:hypothetical protein
LLRELRAGVLIKKVLRKAPTQSGQRPKNNDFAIFRPYLKSKTGLTHTLVIGKIGKLAALKKV